jgi:hypothetical protein
MEFLPNHRILTSLAPETQFSHEYQSKHYSIPIFGVERDVQFLFTSAYWNPYQLGDKSCKRFQSNYDIFGTFIFTPKKYNFASSISNDEFLHLNQPQDQLVDDCNIPPTEIEFQPIRVPFNRSYGTQFALIDREVAKRFKMDGSVDHSLDLLNPNKLAIPHPFDFKVTQQDVHTFDLDLSSVKQQLRDECRQQSQQETDQSDRIFDHDDLDLSSVKQQLRDECRQQSQQETDQSDRIFDHDSLHWYELYDATVNPEYKTLKLDHVTKKERASKKKMDNQNDESFEEIISNHLMISLPYPIHLTNSCVVIGLDSTRNTSMVCPQSIPNLPSLESTLYRRQNYQFPGQDAFQVKTKDIAFYEVLLPLTIRPELCQQMVTVEPMYGFNLNHLKYSQSLHNHSPLWCLVCIVDFNDVYSKLRFIDFYQEIQRMYLQGTLFPFFELPIFIFTYNSQNIDTFQNDHQPHLYSHENTFNPFDQTSPSPTTTTTTTPSSIYPASIEPYMNSFAKIDPKDLTLSYLRQLLHLLPFDKNEVHIYELNRESDADHSARKLALFEQQLVGRDRQSVTDHSNMTDDAVRASPDSIKLDTLHEATIKQLLHQNYIRFALRKLKPVSKQVVERINYVWGWRGAWYLKNSCQASFPPSKMKVLLDHYTESGLKYRHIWSNPWFYNPNLVPQRYYVRKPTNANLNNNSNDSNHEQQEVDQYELISLHLPPEIFLRSFICNSWNSLVGPGLPTGVKKDFEPHQIPFTPHNTHKDQFNDSVTISSPERQGIEIKCNITYGWDIVSPLCFFLPKHYFYGVHLIPMYFGDYPCSFILEHMPGAALQLLFQPIASCSLPKSEIEQGTATAQTCGAIGYSYTYMQCPQYLVFYFINEIGVGEQLPQGDELDKLIASYESTLNNTLQIATWRNTLFINPAEVLDFFKVKVLTKDKVGDYLKQIQAVEVENHLTALLHRCQSELQLEP